MNNNLIVIIRATLALYQSALRDAWSGSAKNWRMPLFHIVLIVPISFLFQTLSFLFVGFAGGLVAGLLLAVLVSSYLATVAAGMRGEILEFNEVWDETIKMLNPVISVLFLFFLVTFILEMTIGAAVPLLMLLVKIAIAVFLNPIPEELITRGSTGMEAVHESFNFVKDNFLEWFIPWTICFLLFVAPFLGVSGSLVMILTTEPLSLVRSIFFIFNPNDLLSNPLKISFIFALFYLVYFIFIFRAVLYSKLATSTRRKRVYQFQSGEIGR